jgi:large subunit ribosomal protein L4
MTTIDVVNVDGKKSGSVELPAELFDVPANLPLMHQVVVGQLAAARQGTHKTKTRGEVRGGGHKPWRQKGTGRARQGSRRAPQWKGGGVVHGPVPRDYSHRTPKKMKVAALRGALSDRARNGALHVVETFVTGDTPSTKAAIATLRKLTEASGGRDSGRGSRVLVVLGDEDRLNWLSLRNEPTVHLIEVGQLNTYDVLASDDVIFTTEALSAFAGVEPTPVEPQDAVTSDETADEEDE